MAEVFPGQYTAQANQPVLLFAIGVRINSLHRIHKWFPPTVNTFRMWRYIQTRRPCGHLAGYLFVYRRGLGMSQYWQNFDSLEALSHDKTQPHLAAWQQLARLTKSDQTFGYWHETYEIAPGTSECIYGSMPRFGLASATAHVGINQATEAASARLDGNSH